MLHFISFKDILLVHHYLSEPRASDLCATRPERLIVDNSRRHGSTQRDVMVLYVHTFYFLRRGTFSDYGMTNVGIIDRVCVCVHLSVFSHACLRACSKSPWLMALFLEKKNPTTTTTTLASAGVVHAAYAHVRSHELGWKNWEMSAHFSKGEQCAISDG